MAEKLACSNWQITCSTGAGDLEIEGSPALKELMAQRLQQALAFPVQLQEVTLDLGKRLPVGQLSSQFETGRRTDAALMVNHETELLRRIAALAPL